MDARKISDIRLNNESVRALSGLNPAKSISALLSEWALIAAAIAVHIYYPNPVLYFLVWIIIGTRMYALYSLLHDGMHYLICSNRQINDWLCRLLMAWPLFYSLKRIRKAHLAHHKHLKTDEDPEAVHLQYEEFHFPKTRVAMAFIFLKDLTGFNFVYYKLRKMIAVVKNRKFTVPEPDADMLLYYAVIFAVIFFIGWGKEFVLYWLIPYISIYQALNRLRLSTEHFHIPEDKLLQTRTVNLSFIERFIFSPHNLGYHAEHHLYPGVPFYRLSSLHRMLMGNPAYENNVIVDNSYFSVIKKYIK